MKLNSISGITYNVKDLQASVNFYESVGFRVGKQDDQHATYYVNWFWVDLVVSADVTKDANTSLYIKVDNVDECYQDILAQNLKPVSEPDFHSPEPQCLVCHL